MSDDISPADAARHDELFDEGSSLMEGEVFVDGSGPYGRPGMLARRRNTRTSRLLQSGQEEISGACMPSQSTQYET